MKYLYILILIFPTLIFSQEKLKYNTNGQSIEFEISKNQYYIKFKPDKKTIIKNKIDLKTVIPINENTALTTSNESSLNFKKGKSKTLEDFDYQIEKVEPVLIYKDGVKQVCNEEIIIQISNQSYLKKSDKI